MLTNIAQDDKRYSRQTKIAEIILICHHRWLTQTAHPARRSTCLFSASPSLVSLQSNHTPLFYTRKLIKASLIKDATASKTTGSTPLPGTGMSPRRPQSSRGSTRSQSEGGDTVTVRYRALGAARWKQANRNRLKTEETPDRLQTPEHGWRQIVPASPQGGAPVSRGRPPKIPGAPRDEHHRTKGSEGKINSNHPGGDLIEEHAAEERIPTRPRSAASVGRGTFSSARQRPRSASTSTTVSQYQKKLESAYAMQMRAMDRLHKRKTYASSEGCRKGVGTGQFQSGLDWFVPRQDRSVPTGTSRYGGGVPYFGP